jgi:hypothetical protein
MAYTRLHENPDGEAGKIRLTGGVILLGRSDNSEVAHRWLATVGEAAVGVEQSKSGMGG